MKARLISILTIYIVCTGALSSCKKGFLDKYPLDALSSGTFWKSDADVQQALSGVYATMHSAPFYAGRKPWLDTYSDNAYDRHSYHGFDILTRGIVNSTNVTDAFYNGPYQCIAACNYFLDNVSKAPISAAALNGYSAEVKFLRAMFYFDLVQAYGGVVVYQSAPVSVAASKIPQTSRENVLTFIKSDLDFAIQNLPDNAYRGHAVKASALAQKARVAMFQSDWALAATLTRQIINSGKFSIYPDYRGLFLPTTQQNNPEIIFSDRYLGPSVGNRLLAELGSSAAVAPYQNLVDEYETTSGKMIADPTSGYDPVHPYVNRDPRLAITIQVPTDTLRTPDGIPFLHNDPLLTGYAPLKYVDRSLVPFSQTLLEFSDVVLIRYADILLTYAEAQNELNGPDASIYSALNQIRQRQGVNLPPVDQTKYNTQARLREFIRHERRVELALEGFRYYDLKRWNLMEEKLKAIKNPGGVQLQFGEKNNVLPFPLSEITANPQLKQNAGYQ